MEIPILSKMIEATGALSNIALVIPQVNVGYQPTNPRGVSPPPLIFHYEGENIVTLQSEITDHYVENNSAIQDHMALRPEKITVHGFIGELNDVGIFPPVPSRAITTALASLAVFSPQLSTTAMNAYNTASSLYSTAKNAVDSAVSAWATITQGTGIQTKQQAMFMQFYGYWMNRNLFKIQTPWAIFMNMAIEEMRAIQAEDTRMVTDFFVTFKMIRFARTIESAPGSILDGRAVAQNQKIIDAGTHNPKISLSFADAKTKAGL